MADDLYLLKMGCEGCEAQVMLGPERERLRAFALYISRNILSAPPATKKATWTSAILSVSSGT